MQRGHATWRAEELDVATWHHAVEFFSNIGEGGRAFRVEGQQGAAVAPPSRPAPRLLGRRGFDDELMVDIAVYGMRQRGDTNYYRLLETKLQELHGIKTLISYNYYPEEEFWSIFHRKNFETVKAITDPNNIFRNLYEKTCRASMGR